METVQLILTALSLGSVTAVWLQLRARDKEAVETRDKILEAISGLREEIQANNTVVVASARAVAVAGPGLARMHQAAEDDGGADERKSVLPDAALPSAAIFSEDERPSVDEQTKVFQKKKPRGGEINFNAVRDGLLIEGTYRLLCAESEAKGKPATHCEGEECWQGQEDAGACLCECAGCRTATSCLIRAQRYVSKRFNG